MNRICLKDLKKENIYVRLMKRSQRKLFSKFTPKELKLKIRSFYFYKIKNGAFPLYLLLQMLNKLRIKEGVVYSSINEIKRGQRSTPIVRPKFPIIKDPFYWNILFSLFCDGSSDQWSSQKNKKLCLPAYTSYSKEIMKNYIYLIKHKFGNFHYNIFDGSIHIPPIIDTIFKSEHDINSFNNKSHKVPKFKLTNKFKNEIKKLNDQTKTAIVVRYLVDEGDKSKISLNPRNINLTISNTSKGLIRIIEIILRDLKIKYKIIKKPRIKRKWKTAYIVQIIRSKERKNIKVLYDHYKRLQKEYSLIKLTKIQEESIKNATKYKYKRSMPEFSQSKEIHYLVYKFLQRKKKSNFQEINKMLISKKFNLSMTSLLNVLKRMPITKIKGVIHLNKKKARDYFSYSKKEIINFTNFYKATIAYSKGNKIATIGRKLKIPWSTVRDWVYKRAKPKILHGKWPSELKNRHLN